MKRLLKWLLGILLFNPNDGFGCFVIRRAIAVYQCRFKQWLVGGAKSYARAESWLYRR